MGKILSGVTDRVGIKEFQTFLGRGNNISRKMKMEKYQKSTNLINV